MAVVAHSSHCLVVFMANDFYYMLMKTFLSVLFFGVVVMVGSALQSCIGEKERVESSASIGVGDSVPKFDIGLSDGSLFQSRADRHSVKVVVFFDTECSDCQRFLPEFQKLVTRVRSQENRVDGVEVRCCAIAREQTTAEVADYWKANGFDIPYYSPGNRTLYHQFAQKTIPRVYVVDPKGIVIAIFTDSPEPTYDKLMRAIRKATTHIL